MNPLFNMFGGGGNSLPGPFGNFAQFMQQFNQFKSGFQGDPKQTVQQMLNSGQMTQEQYNQCAQIASMIQSMMGKNGQ